MVRPLLIAFACCAMVAMLPAPTEAGQAALHEGRIPVSVTLTAGNVTTIETGYIERTSTGCFATFTSSVMKGVGGEAAYASVPTYDHAACRMTVALYKEPPSHKPFCGYSCRGLGTPSEEDIRSNWTIIAGPVTVG